MEAVLGSEDVCSVCVCVCVQCVCSVCVSVVKCGVCCVLHVTQQCVQYLLFRRDSKQKKI